MKMKSMDKIRRKRVKTFLIAVIFLLPFFSFTVSINDATISSFLPIQNLPPDNSILIPESAQNGNMNQQKLSPYFQQLLKTGNLGQTVSCIVLLKDQVTKEVVTQIKHDTSCQDRNAFRKLLYAETKKRVEPQQKALTTPILLLGGKIKGHSVILNALFVEITLENLPKLAELSQIARIEPDYRLQIQLDHSQQIVLNTTSPGWNYTYDGSGVIVAVCDTGIDKNHPNLVGRVIAEETFIGGTPDDTNGHGTHVAGIIASNNSIFHGIASGVSLVNVKIMNSAGSGYSTDLFEGVEWLLNGSGPGVDIINLSAGTPDNADGESVLSRFVDAIVSEYGIVWVNAAGNSGPSSSSLEIPGDSMNCISVANFKDNNDPNPSAWSIFDSSSRGPTLDGRKKPDLAAPGTNIKSCNSNWESSDDFVLKSGTSMAAPHVTGAAALLWQYLSINYASLDPWWYALAVKAILIHTSYDLGTPGYDYAYGYGAVDMGATWNFIQSGHLEVENLSRPYGICKYRIVLTSPQAINVTLVWNRYATTNYTHITSYQLADIDMYLTNADGIPLASSTNKVDNVEQISYFAPNGTYYLIVGISTFTHDPQEFVIVSNVSLTLTEKFQTWDLFQILFVVSIVGMVVVGAIYIYYWLRERRAEELDEEDVEYESTWPDWSSPPAY